MARFLICIYIRQFFSIAITTSKAFTLPFSLPRKTPITHSARPARFRIRSDRRVRKRGQKGVISENINRFCHAGILVQSILNDGAHRSFESCLFEACEKPGWEAIAGRATGIWGIRSHVRGSWTRRVPEANELLLDLRNETSAPRRSDTLVALLGIDDVETLKNVDGVGQLCLFPK